MWVLGVVWAQKAFVLETICKGCLDGGGSGACSAKFKSIPRLAISVKVEPKIGIKLKARIYA